MAENNNPSNFKDQSDFLQNKEQDKHIQDLFLDINSLNARQAASEKSIDQLVKKVDETVASVNRFTVEITKLVTLHEERIKSIEKTGDILQTLVEQRRTETMILIDNNKVAINKLNLELGRLQDFHENQHKKNSEMDSKLVQLEKWRWIMLGGVLFLVYILDKIPDIFHLLGQVSP